jgi:hypothetical protein
MLGGQSFGAATQTGTLAPPSDQSVDEQGGRYLVTMPAASAALLTLPASAR